MADSNLSLTLQHPVATLISDPVANGSGFTMDLSPWQLHGRRFFKTECIAERQMYNLLGCFSASATPQKIIFWQNKSGNCSSLDIPHIATRLWSSPWLMCPVYLFIQRKEIPTKCGWFIQIGFKPLRRGNHVSTSLSVLPGGNGLLCTMDIDGGGHSFCRSFLIMPVLGLLP